MPSPNDNFTAGQILTDTECNQFPRGVMAFNTAIVSDTTITSEEVQITGSSFTAVVNRLYKITYYEPELSCPSEVDIGLRIRQTNLAGTQLNFGNTHFFRGAATNNIVVAVTTFTAGLVNVVATLITSSSTVTASRSATKVAFLLVEDIGPA